MTPVVQHRRSKIRQAIGAIGQTALMRKQYHFWPGREGLDAWDIDRLILLSEGLPIEQVAISSIEEIDSVYWFNGAEQPTVRKVVEHVRLIQGVDTFHPILLGPDGRVMDGMHRIARALLDGRDAIGARRFPELPEPDHLGCQPDELPY